MGYITLAELGASSVPTPSSGKDQLYFDSSDGLLKRKASSGTVTIVSASEGCYKTLWTDTGRLANDQVAATLAFSQNGSAMLATTANHASPLYFDNFYIASADYALTGFTTKLRVRLTVGPNATAPGTITLTAGLYPVTIAGGTDIVVPTLGTVTSGSTAAVVNPTASTYATTTGSDFTIPSDGVYALGVVTSATLANNCAMQVTAHLQYRHV